MIKRGMNLVRRFKPYDGFIKAINSKSRNSSRLAIKLKYYSAVNMRKKIRHRRNF